MQLVRSCLLKLFSEVNVINCSAKNLDLQKDWGTSALIDAGPSEILAALLLSPYTLNSYHFWTNRGGELRCIFCSWLCVCVGFELTMFSLLSGLEQKSRLGKKAPMDLWDCRPHPLFPTQPLSAGHWSYQPLGAGGDVLVCSFSMDCMLLLFKAYWKLYIWTLFHSPPPSFCPFTSWLSLREYEIKMARPASSSPCWAGRIPSLINLKIGFSWSNSWSLWFRDYS